MPLSLLERLEFISFSTLAIAQFPDILSYFSLCAIGQRAHRPQRSNCHLGRFGDVTQLRTLV